MALCCTCSSVMCKLTIVQSPFWLVLMLHSICIGRGSLPVHVSSAEGSQEYVDGGLSFLQVRAEPSAENVTILPKVGTSAAVEFSVAVRDAQTRGIDFSTFDTDPMDHVDNVKVWPLQFMHIPKNAGSAIELAAYDSQPRVNWGLWLSYFWEEVVMPDGNKCPAWHVPPKYHRVQVYSDDRVREVFCFVRHPYDRAVSEYTWLLNQSWAAEKSEEFGTGLMAKPACTPAGLNHFLQAALRKVIDERQPFIHGCHFVPQADYIFDREKQWCDTVLKHSELPDNFNDFMRSEGYNVSLDERINDSHEICSMTRHDLDRTTKQLLDTVYKIDFERLDF